MKNVVYLIMDKGTGEMLDLAKRYFQKEISFHSFFPARYLAENFRNRDLSDRHGEQYKIVEGEIVEFLNNQLTVAYEEELEESNFRF